MESEKDQKLPQSSVDTMKEESHSAVEIDSTQVPSLPKHDSEGEEGMDVKPPAILMPSSQKDRADSDVSASLIEKGAIKLKKHNHDDSEGRQPEQTRQTTILAQDQPRQECLQLSAPAARTASVGSEEGKKVESPNHNREVSAAAAATGSEPKESITDFLNRIVRKLPEATNAYHRELLLGVFVHSDSSDFMGHIKKTKSPPFDQCKKQRKRRIGEPLPDAKRSRNGNMSDKLDRCPLSLLPLEISKILSQFKGSNKPSVAGSTEAAASKPVDSTMADEKDISEQDILHSPTGAPEDHIKKPPIDSEKDLRHNGYASRSLPELEKLVRWKFESSDVGKKATSQTKNESFHDCLTRHEAINPQVDRADFQPFSLLYNECSMAAIANWACDPDKDESGWKNQNAVLSMDFPVAPTIFRRCQQCEGFGHFEIECPKLLQGNRLVQLGEDIHVQRLVRNFVEVENAVSSDTDRNTQDVFYCHICESTNSGDTLLVCDGCDKLYHTTCLDPPLQSIPEGDWFCPLCEGYNSDVSSVVELEGCDGYVIEQRKRPTGGVPKKSSTATVATSVTGKSSTESTFTDIIGVADGSVLLEEFPVPPPDSRGLDLQLQMGEICWAKRAHAALGKPGRNEWWPAQVNNVITDPRSLRLAEKETSPFLVRLLCVSHANRVRASHVLPFWEYYKHLGSNAVANHKFGRYFRRALEEAVGLLGLKSLREANEKAEEMRRQPSRRSLPVVKSTPKRLLNWSQAQKTKKDGFLIEALCDPNSQNEQSRRRQAKWDVAAEAAGKVNIIGCIVAWSELDESNNDTVVGEVVDVDEWQTSALVRRIPDWRRCLEVPIQSGHISFDSSHGSTAWVPVEGLHVVSNGPSSSVKDGFAGIILHQLRMIQDKNNSIPEKSTCADEDVAVPATGSASSGTAESSAKKESTTGEKTADVDATPSKLTIPLPSQDRGKHGKRIMKSGGKIGSDKEENFGGEGLEMIGDQRSSNAVIDLARRSSTEDNSDDDSPADAEDDAGGDGDADDSDFVDSPSASDDYCLSGVDTGDDSDTLDGRVKPSRKLSRKSPRKPSKVSRKRRASSKRAASKREDDKQSDCSTSQQKSIYKMSDSELQARGIYHVEKILDTRKADERGMATSREYLIKWKGFSKKDATWEPESNILNKTFLAKFRLQKLIDQIEDTKEVADVSSPTYRVWMALKRANKGVDKKVGSQPQSPGREPESKMCPFCGARFKTGMSLGGHVSVHRGEKNYDLVKEAGKLLDPSYFDSVDQD